MKILGKKCGLNINIKFIGLLAGLFIACGHSEKKEKTPLVKVADEILYLEEIPPAIYKEGDSAEAVKQYIQNWIRQHVFIHYARQNVDTNRINRLVQTYRNDLLRDLYENQLKLKWKNDIRLSEEELQNYYKEHKKNFIAHDTLIRWRYLIIQMPDKDASKIKQLFFSKKPEDRETLESYFSHFMAFKLDTTGWYAFSKAAEIIPPLISQNIKPTKYTFSQKKRLYLVEINRVILPGDILPYDYLRNTLKKYVMERKLQEEIRRARNEMVEKAYKKNQIKHY